MDHHRMNRKNVERGRYEDREVEEVVNRLEHILRLLLVFYIGNIWKRRAISLLK